MMSAAGFVDIRLKVRHESSHLTPLLKRLGLHARSGRVVGWYVIAIATRQ
jgi:hypothetical protein